MPTGRLLASLLLLGGLNGLVARIASAGHDASNSNAFAALTAVTPTEMLVLVVASRLVWTWRADRMPLAAITVFSFLVLTPSSLASWIAVAGLGLVVAWQARGDARTGGVLFAMLAFCEIWLSVGDPLFGQPLRAFDALLVGGILSWLREGGAVLDNLVVNGFGHTVVVLTGCSTAAGLPWILLGWAAIVSHFKMPRLRRAIVPLTTLGCGYAILNLIRLAVMSWSPEAYAVMHGTIGASLFDAAALTLMIVCAFAALRPTEERQT